MTVISFDAEGMRKYRASRAKHRWVRTREEITLRVVHQRGGRTLEVFKLLDGRLFGAPWLMTSDEVARRLNLPVSEVIKVAESAYRVIWDEYRRLPEYKEFKAHQLLHEPVDLKGPPPQPT